MTIDANRWGGSELLGRDVRFAARADDRRAAPTELVDLVRDHVGLSVSDLAPLVVELAHRDATARLVVERLADEIVLLVERALRDLRLDAAKARIREELRAG